MTKEISTYYYDSPIGMIEITSVNNAISVVMFKDADNKPSEGLLATEKVSDEIIKCVMQLTEYFEGIRQTFDLNIDQPGTEFRQTVWKELLNIPFGKTISYLELSKRIGNVKSIRAVGTSNGANMISIIVPCHRVIGANGDLTGYAGYLWRKKWLLEYEQKVSGFEQFDLFE